MAFTVGNLPHWQRAVVLNASATVLQTELFSGEHCAHLPSCALMHKTPALYATGRPDHLSWGIRMPSAATLQISLKCHQKNIYFNIH